MEELNLPKVEERLFIVKKAKLAVGGSGRRASRCTGPGAGQAGDRAGTPGEVPGQPGGRAGAPGGAPAQLN